MKHKIIEFVSRCLVKAEYQVPSILLQHVMIPEWKWERISMYFILGLPLTSKRKDYIWVIIDILTKSTHFLPVRSDYPLEKLAKLYSSIKLASYEALYGCKCKSLLYWFELNEKKLARRESILESLALEEIATFRKKRKTQSNIYRALDLMYEEEPVKILALEI
ncbi:integrase [Gossypium australe]|uniref:Integrase n=1 Tax=Gossypium australe TaxID=47621 RepID=A0A5B6X1D1_9ROSI|nr:integrase [Gossypium australe]